MKANETDHHPLVFGEADFTNLMHDAEASIRRRTAQQFHKDHSDPVQRVLIAACLDTYVAPHCHPDKKWELVVLLRGALDILLFSENGDVEKRISLCEKTNLVCEYPADKYHSAVVMKPNTLVFEVKNGPFIAESAKIFPDWAPPEQSDLALPFLRKLKSIQTGENVI